MSLKLKIILVFIIIIILSAFAGYFYYKDTVNFDNKKQYEIGENFFRNKNYQEAYAAFLKIRPYSKYRKIALLKQAISAEKLGDWTIAENKYDSFLKISKDSIFYEKARYSYAKSCFYNKKLDKATTTFLAIKKYSSIEDYRIGACYFLGKIAIEKNLITAAKKYYLEYTKNVPTGNHALKIAYELMHMVLSHDEAVLVSKIFLANQKYAEAIVVLKDVPNEKSWTYRAIAEYYKNNTDKYKELSKEGYLKNCSKINIEDLKNFTDFYLSMQNDYLKAVSDLQKTSAKDVISDYLIYKKAKYLSDEEKISEYKQIVQLYPKSPYIPDCLVSIFFDFADKKQYKAAVRIGQIYLEKFPDKIDEPQMLFWTGKYLQKLKRDEEAKTYFNKVIDKYPSSYYAFRASRVDQSQRISWYFDNKMLPDTYQIDFPMKTIDIKNIELIKLFIEVNDDSIWEDIPFDNNAIRAWVEYKKGNIQKSIYLANKFILDSKQKIPYDDSVWKLAFPIYYADEVNYNAKINNLDAFLMLSLIREESHFNPSARSSSNAVGLMQLMMPTASNIAEQIKVEPPTDILLQNPKYNITLGTAYFAYALGITDKFQMYAIGGYNGGPNAMKKWVEKYKTLDTDEFVEKIPYLESKNYIKKVYRSRYNYDKIY